MTGAADLIDADRLRTLLPGVRVEYHPSLNSTQDLAHRLAADPNTKLPVLVVAEEQTAGRGRGANRWWTGPRGAGGAGCVDHQRAEDQASPQKRELMEKQVRGRLRQ